MDVVSLSFFNKQCDNSPNTLSSPKHIYIALQFACIKAHTHDSIWAQFAAQNKF